MLFIRYSLLVVAIFLWKLPLTPAQVIYKDTVNGITFDKLSSEWTSHMNIYYLQEDESSKGNFLVSTGRGVGSLSEQYSYSNIAGSPNSTSEGGYEEGYGTAAQFSEILSFVRHNSSELIVVDYGNNCLRWVNLLTNETRYMAGICRMGDQRTRAGRFEDTLFNKPAGIVKGEGEEKYYLTEKSADGGMLRVIDTKAGYTRIILRTSDDYAWALPSGIIFNSEKQTLYITTHNDIYSVDVDVVGTTNMTSGIMGNKDGELGESQFSGSTNIAMISSDMLMVLAETDSGFSTIRLIDLENGQASSLKVPSNHIGSEMHCFLHRPNDNKIYIGRDGGISMITYHSEGRRDTLEYKLLATLMLLVGVSSGCVI